MELSINHDLAKRLNRQFWVMVVFLFLPLAAICADTTGSASFATMLGSLKNSAVPLTRLVVAAAYVIGLWFIISAIQELKKIGQSVTMQAQTGMGGPIIKFLIGVILMYLPSTVNIGVSTLWGHGFFDSSYASAMTYTADASDPFSPAKEGAVAILRVVGYVSFVRGLVILSHSAEPGSQQGSVGKGMMHLVGGIFAINIVETIKIVGNSLGISII